MPAEAAVKMRFIGADDNTTAARGIDASKGLPTFATAPRRYRGHSALWSCPVCGSALVQPTNASVPSTGTYRVERRCPECERRDTVEAGLGEVNEFDRHLVQGRDALEADYRRFAMRTMSEDAERIIAALRSGALQPSDF